MKIANLEITKYKIKESFFIDFIYKHKYSIGLGITSKSIYIETDNYWLMWLYTKLNNEDFVNLFINNRLYSLKHLFANLYLGEFL